MVKKLLFLILVGACASTGLDERASLRTAFAQQNWAQAASILEGEKALYKEDKDKLLALMEKGHLSHAQQKWAESAELFKQAFDLHDKLYTVSVSSKIAAAIVNDSSDVYYGEAYEVATLHLLQTINFLMLWRDSKSRDDLFRARAQVVAWNKFLENRARDSELAPVYKDDLMAKLLGAQVHELINSRSDLQIALDLYVDAHEVLIKNYSAYPSFNSKSAAFVKDYKKFPKFGLEKVVKEYIEPTQSWTLLQDKLQQKVIALAREIRSSRVNTYLKVFGKTNNDFPKPKKSPPSNVRVVASFGLAPLKQGETQYIGLTSALEDPKASSGAKVLAGVSAVALTLFAADKLGLMPPPNSWNPAGSQLGLEMSFAAAKSASVKFELPAVSAVPIKSTYELIAIDESGKEVFKTELPLVQPVGEIAQQAIAEAAVARYWRVGVRLALKHAAAIAASFATYKALAGRKNDNDFLARNAAVFQYLAAAKGIEVSERADTRALATLPESFNLTDFYLAPGKYKINIVENPVQGAAKTTHVGLWEITAMPSVFYARL